MVFLQEAQPVPVPPPIQGPASELRGNGAQQPILGGGWHPWHPTSGTTHLDQPIRQGFHRGSNRDFTRKNGSKWWMGTRSDVKICQKPWCWEHVHRKHVSLGGELLSNALVPMQILCGLIPWTGQTDWGSTQPVDMIWTSIRIETSNPKREHMSFLPQVGFTIYNNIFHDCPQFIENVMTNHLSLGVFSNKPICQVHFSIALDGFSTTNR